MYTDIRDRQLTQNAAQMFSRAGASDGAIAYNPRSFIVPCVPGIIQSVLQRSCNAVIVLRYNKNEAIQCIQLIIPAPGLFRSIRFTQ
ncbi:hypothetical protein D3C73_908300 [compost metagenome]